MAEAENTGFAPARHAKSRAPYIWDATWLDRQPTLTCKRCKIELPANPAWFRIRTTSRTALHSWCRCCEARHYDENKAKRHKAQKEYYRRMRQAEPEKLASQRRAWREANKEKNRASYSKWRESNLDEARARQVSYEAKRRAAKRDAGGSFTPDHIKQMFSAQRGRCWYCSGKLEKYHVEHRIPLARGGTNGPENLVISCPPCNHSKGVKMPWELKNPRLL